MCIAGMSRSVAALEDAEVTLSVFSLGVLGVLDALGAGLHSTLKHTGCILKTAC